MHMHSSLGATVASFPSIPLSFPTMYSRDNPNELYPHNDNIFGFSITSFQVWCFIFSPEYVSSFLKSNRYPQA